MLSFYVCGKCNVCYVDFLFKRICFLLLYGFWNIFKNIVYLYIIFVVIIINFDICFFVIRYFIVDDNCK